ncbi:MAG: murein L,D-transpeptidase catalytic domain-containing protein [Bacteriovoracia bacterium]
MRNFVFFTIVSLMALCAGAHVRAATRYNVELELKLQDHDSKTPLVLPASQGYSYEVSEQLTDIAVIRVFSPDGKALDGYYEITAEELRQILSRKISAGLKATENGAEKEKCATCQTMDATADKLDPFSDRRPALERPKAEPVPLPKPRPEAAPKATPATTPPEAKKEPLCELYNKFHAMGVPSAPLKQALLFYSRQQKEKAGPRKVTKPVIGIADYSQNSRNKRFYLLDLANGKLLQEKVSHGGGMAGAGYPGDPQHRGMLKKCGTKGGNGLQRPGFFKFGDYYYSDHGRGNGWPLLAAGKNGVKLVGLTPEVNWMAENDGVVAHEAKYNFDGTRMPMGRTNACLGFVPGRGKPLLAKLAGGGLLYSYAPQCVAEMRPALKQVPEWKTFCGVETVADLPLAPVPANGVIPADKPKSKPAKVKVVGKPKPSPKPASVSKPKVAKPSK